MQPFPHEGHLTLKLNHIPIHMKRISTPAIVLFTTALAVGLGSCKDSCKNEMIYDANVPVYLSYEDLRKPVTLESSKALEKPGKFWRKDAYLFVSDVNKGIHIYNVSNANAPQELVFVNVPGVMDVAVKGNYLLADSYTDLLVLDISNASQPTQVKRLQNVFPYNAFKVQAHEGYPVVAPDETKGVVVDWNVEKVKDEYACSGAKSPVFFDCANCNFMEGGIAAVGSQNAPATFSGGGSLAAFAVMGDYLYTVNSGSNSLLTYSIADPLNPSKTSEQIIGWNVETIVAYQRFLFIGTQSGMQVFGIQDNPGSPTYISAFSHATACDPVIVQNQTAYVTLRGGTPCQGFNNQLDVLNVQNIQNPTLIRTYPMSGPHGLGIDGHILAICEANYGVRVYNAADPANLLHLSTITSLNAKDVILYDGIALFIGETGIWVYTYDSAGNFQGGGSISIVG